MSAHTPGPWRLVRTLDAPPHCWHVESADGRAIANLPKLVPEAREQQACDAHLLAASADVLEALIRLHDVSLPYADGRLHEELGQARTQAHHAIAKATQPFGNTLPFKLPDDEASKPEQSAKDTAIGVIGVLVLIAWPVLLLEAVFPGSWFISLIGIASMFICSFVVKAHQ